LTRFEAADLFYFALTKCTAAGVSLEDIERNLDLKSLIVEAVITRFISIRDVRSSTGAGAGAGAGFDSGLAKSNEAIVNLVKPIIQDVRDGGDAAVLKYTHKFEKEWRVDNGGGE
jgi:phosphoribosyl-ATP pyrophosphohydrolase/phosphoribosyl-AMP cyclohydrolase/histidinol dehydrogenase